MEEGAAFTRHRIFIAAAEIEGACGRAPGQRPIDRHERVIAVDHDPRPFRPGERRELLDAVEQAPASEQHVTDEDEVVVARAGSLEQPIPKILERLRRDLVLREPAVLGPAVELTPGAVELAVAGQYAQGAVTARAG